MKKADKICLVMLAIVIFLSTLVLVGWYLNITLLKSIMPGFITMKANTALSLILLSLSGIFLLKEEFSNKKIFGIILSFVVVIFAVLTISQYLFKINLNIDEFFFWDTDGGKKWPPGRFAPITGISFIFLGTANILNAVNPIRFIKLNQGLVIITWIASLQALIGYMSGNTYTFGSAYYTQIALHTGICIIAISSVNLIKWSRDGYLRYLSGSGVAGRVGRKLLVCAIVVPPLINVVQLYLSRMDIFDADFGVLFRVVGIIIFFAWVAMTTGKYLDEVDEKRALAEELQIERTKELQRALMARDDLLSICSHELRTPISSMKLQTQFVKYQIEKGDPNALSPKKMLQIIEQSDQQLDRLTKLIENMLDFSRINSGKFVLSKEEFDLHGMLKNLLETFKAQLKANQCEINLSVESEVPVLVYWDQCRVEQLVTNLITNAMKYGGNRPIDIQVFQNTQSTGIKIRDHGMGILSVDFNRIFEPYERAISVSKISGLGLGLFISKKIVEAHGGSINVESVEGIGSTFTVLMPNKIKQNFGEHISYGI